MNDTDLPRKPPSGSTANPTGVHAVPSNEAEIRCAIERYAAAWSSGDRAAIAACYHEHFTLHYFGRSVLSGDHAGRTASLQTLAEFSRRTQRRLVSIVGILAGPERGAIVAREVVGEGERAVEVERVLVYAVEDGLLRECWVYDQDQRLIDSIVDAVPLTAP